MLFFGTYVTDENVQKKKLTKKLETQIIDFFSSGRFGSNFFLHSIFPANNKIEERNIALINYSILFN